VYGVESCKIVFLGKHLLFTCSDTFAVATIQTDRQTDDLIMPTADDTACSRIGYKWSIQNGPYSMQITLNADKI